MVIMTKITMISKKVTIQVTLVGAVGGLVLIFMVNCYLVMVRITSGRRASNADIIFPWSHA